MPAPAGIIDDELTVLLAELRDDLGAYLDARPGAGPRSLADIIEFNRANTDTEMIHFGQELFEMAAASEGTGSEAYAQARARCLAWAIDECLEPAFAAEQAPEFLLTPVSAPASKSDLVLGDRREDAGAGTCAPSIAGWPVLSLPMGLVKGLPVGMMLISRPDSEARMLAVAHELEDALGLRASGTLEPTWVTSSRG